MKKLKVNIILILMAMLLSAFAFSYSKNIQEVDAATYSNVGTELSLVGYNGYNPSDYFDELTHMEVKSSDKKYRNYNGYIENDYNILTAKNSNVIGDISVAKTTITPYSDYIKLANQGCLYVSLSAGIVTEDGEKNSIQLSLSTNGKTETKINDKIGSETESYYFPYYFQTDFIKVSASSNIVVEIKNLDKASWFSSAKFKIFEPKLIFTVKLDEVSLNQSAKTAYYNDMVNLYSTTTLSNVTGGDLITYYQQLHSVNYEIIEGQDKVNLIGNSLFFIGKSSGIVKLRAKVLKNSLLKDFIYSNIIEINYFYEEVVIKVDKNFENCAEIIGEGNYYLGYQVDLKTKITSDYAFGYWLINNQKFTTLNISFFCTSNIKVQLFCYKYLSIESIKVKDKIYDGNTNCEVENVVVSGIENNDNVSVKFKNIEFATSSVGLKAILIDTPELTGDVEFYLLKNKLPNVNATILQKEIKFEVLSQNKIYGESDPEAKYTFDGLVNEDVLGEKIYRETGETIGDYKYIVEVNNLNYKTATNEAFLTINKKPIKITTEIFSKIYDGNNYYSFNFEPENLPFEDEINISLYFEYENSNNELKNLKLISTSIIGTKTNNYFVEHLENYQLKVMPKPIKIVTHNYEKVYGEIDPALTYEVIGLINNDKINVTISRDKGEDVGVYKISLVASKNTYYAPEYTNAFFTIKKRDVSITANFTEKTYGELDPDITYTGSNMVEGVAMTGKLSREVGENVGEYNILLGTLFNENYNIDFKSNIFKINKRKIDVDFGKIEKEFDGTNSVNISNYKYINVVNNENPELSFNAEFDSINAGTNKINITNISIDNNNYEIEKSKQIDGVIHKRKVTITPKSVQKIYGDNDPVLTYEIGNSYDGIKLSGQLTRDTGNNVGYYFILQGTLTNENNSNFEITFNSNSLLTITHKIITYKIDNYTKAYGEVDPTFVMVVENFVFPYQDNLNNVVSGFITRKSGETPGVYEIVTSNLYCINTNYKLNYTGKAELTIVKKDITIYASNFVKTYGENDPEFKFIVSDEKYIKDLSNFQLERESGEFVGQYEIRPAHLTNELFNINFVPAKLTIQPRDITLKVDDKVKYYGSKDPEITFTILSGILINGDKINTISSGTLVREEGESVGKYKISRNNFGLNENYNLTLITGELRIEKQNITIKAIDECKKYKNEDPKFTYEIISGSICYNDIITGNLERQAGEKVGEYAIERGTLAINDNYNLQFIPGTFTIEKLKLKITVSNYTKVYGELDPEIKVNFDGELKDDLMGEITRKSGENVGTYEYVSTYENHNYDITCQLGKLEITKRPITIKSKSYTINYGDEQPTFEYEITNGVVLDSDVIQGELYKIGENNVGTFKILSSLNLGRNYQITYQAGELIVKPLNLTIKALNTSKIYGEEDPEITYEIVSGVILEQDYFAGNILREQGENVGEYKLINNLSNDNYIIDEVIGSFIIHKRQVNLHIRVKDKIFDGNVNAEIESLSASNILNKEVNVVYNVEQSAKFTSSNVQNDVRIEFSEIYLDGEKKDNYNLILPAIYANITNEKLEYEDIVVYANNSTELIDGAKIVVENQDIDSFEGDLVVKSFDIKIQNNDSDIDITKNLKFSIKQNNVNLENFRVYITDENGVTHKVKTYYENGNVTFSTNIMGKVVLTAYSTIWVDNCAMISTILLFVILIIVLILKIRKNKKICKN